MQLHRYRCSCIFVKLATARAAGKLPRVTETPSDIVFRAWARLMRAQRIALGAVERELKHAGLPALVWYDVLWELERAGEKGLRPFELERAMLLAQYNLSRLIDRIEDAGLVERRAYENDGRGQILAITEQGRATRRAMWPIYARAVEAAVGSRLSPSQAQTSGQLARTVDRRRRARLTVRISDVRRGVNACDQALRISSASSAAARCAAGRA